MSVSVNPPKTPVTAGSSGVATATIPNVCKMPGPPAPFVPAPLPNIGKSGDSPKDYSKKVTIEGKKVAIKGASFKSMGDMASKGTGGGLVSANTHGPTKFLGPGSMDVKIEGKNVQLLSDPMLNNCGSSGSPPNAATMLGVIQESGMVIAVWKGEECPICGKYHETLEETKETKAEMGSLVKHFRDECQGALKAGKNVATMLGVVECKKCGKKYASQSGATSRELCNAADNAGMMKHYDERFRYADEAATGSFKEKKRIEEANAVKEKMEKHLDNSSVFQEAWAEAFEGAKESERLRETPASYFPGYCAAPAALLLLLIDGGLPGAMTEEYFNLSGRSTGAPIRYYDQKAGSVVARHFKPGETVPPCGTCEILLPLLICDGGKTSCDHPT